MPKPFKQWTVLPHGKLTHLDDDILSVTGDIPMPFGKFPRRMTVVRSSKEELVVYSAVALDEPEMTQLEEFGRPAYLIVPNDVHRMDAKIWKDRYPALKVIAPLGVKKKIEDVVPVDGTDADFGDPNVRLLTVPGTDAHELAMVVKGESGTSLVVNDLIFNVDDRPGFGGFLLHLLGQTGDGPKIPKLVQMKEIENKAAVRAQLEEWSRIPDLQRVIMSHGQIVTRTPGRVLAHLAETLAD